MRYHTEPFQVVHGDIAILQMGSLVVTFQLTSLDWQNIKNVIEAATHNLRMSCVSPLPVHTALIFLRMAGVIGSLERDTLPSLPCTIITPVIT